MPNIVLECALGNDCTKGADGGIWKTPSVNQDLAMQLVEQHVKFAHQNVAGRRHLESREVGPTNC